MRIAVIHHNSDLDNDYGAYLSTLLDELAEESGYQVKEHFLIKLRKEQITGSNIIIHFVVPSHNKLTLSYWYSIKLPKLIKHYQIEKVISLKGFALSTSVQQLLVIPDEVAISAKPAEQIKKRMTGKDSAKIKMLTYSKSLKEKVLTTFSKPETGVFYIPYSAPPVFRPREWHDKLYLKSKYSENKEYFACFLREDDLDTMMLLLKAFSVFKKWQNSSMKMLILSKGDGFSDRLKDKLSTYKYRGDVTLVEEAEKREIAEMAATAYALVYFPQNDSDLWAIVVSMISAVPVITSYTSSAEEYVGKGGVFIDKKDPAAIGKSLIDMYKNEQTRTKMADEAEEKSVEYLQKNVAPILLSTLGILQ